MNPHSHIYVDFVYVSVMFLISVPFLLEFLTSLIQVLKTGFLKAPRQWNRKLNSDFSVASFRLFKHLERGQDLLCLELGPMGARSYA